MNVTPALEPEDEHLSTSEIKSLIQALSVADRLRLARIARFYSRRCPIDGDDLLSEAVVAALSGNRRCPRHLNLMAFLAGAMKSIVFNENRKFSNERRAENTDDAVDDSPVARVHDKGSSPEEDAIAESEANARIVGAVNRAIITVNENSAPVRRRFSIGHEIGHWHNHRGRSLVCRSDEIGRNGNGGVCLERQADAFAADLLLPRYILRPFVAQYKTLTFDVLRQIAEIFNTSLPATAIRLVEIGSWPSILLCHSQSGRKWFVRSSLVSQDWFPRSDLDPASHAFDIVFGHVSNQAKPKPIKASAWFERRDAERFELQEQSIRMHDGDTLTLLLVSDSKGQKPLSVWLLSKYCKERGITPASVAPIIKQAISNGQ